MENLNRPINGWTKAKIIQHIKDNFKGKAFNYSNPKDRKCGAEVCVYLTKDGRKCAVGLFIPDGHNGQRHIGTVSGLLFRFPDLSDVMPLDTSSMSGLQRAHDESGEETTLEEMLEYIEKNIVD